MKTKVALVLSSGGARGLAHIGVIRALEDAEMEIMAVSGSSIGALIGGVYAMGKLDVYADWVRGMSKRKIWELMDFTITTDGLVKGEKVFNKMREIIPDMDIEAMPLPFAAVATDLIHEREVVFRSGSYYEAVRASVAIPAVFKPVKQGNRILVDGGVLNPVPIAHVDRSLADILVAVNLYGPSKGFSEDSRRQKRQKLSVGYLSLLKHTANAMIHRLAQTIIENHQPDIVVSIPYDLADTFAFHKAQALIDYGRLAGEQALSAYFKTSQS